MSFDSRRSKATRLPTHCVTSLISHTSIASDMLCPPLAEQVRYYKETEGGVENMNNELREFWEEKLEKASTIITKANVMKHDYERLQEDCRKKDAEVASL